MKYLLLLLLCSVVQAGTACILSQYVNGLHAVNRNAVKWYGSTRPQVVVAQCG